jgi:hypothetical protein
MSQEARESEDRHWEQARVDEKCADQGEQLDRIERALQLIAKALLFSAEVRGSGMDQMEVSELRAFMLRKE